MWHLSRHATDGQTGPVAARRLPLADSAEERDRLHSLVTMLEPIPNLEQARAN